MQYRSKRRGRRIRSATKDNSFSTIALARDPPKGFERLCSLSGLSVSFARLLLTRSAALSLVIFPNYQPAARKSTKDRSDNVEYLCRASLRSNPLSARSRVSDATVKVVSKARSVSRRKLLSEDPSSFSSFQTFRFDVSVAHARRGNTSLAKMFLAFSIS